MSQLWVTIYGQVGQAGARVPEVLEDMKRLGVPADISIGLAGLGPKSAEAARQWAARGNLVTCGVYPGDMDRSCHDSNWWAYDVATTRRLLKLYKKEVEALGLVCDGIGSQGSMNVFVIPSWYPSHAQPNAGIFIREHFVETGHRIAVVPRRCGRTRRS